jgi:hypothetical protein
MRPPISEKERKGCHTIQLPSSSAAVVPQGRIQERVRAGLVRARAQGKRLGRPRKAGLPAAGLESAIVSAVGCRAELAPAQ